jgi:hypothetical protein
MNIKVAECSRAFKELETRRKELLAELTGWSSSCLGFRPTPSAWSAVEVLDHIVRCEAGTIADIQVGLHNPHTFGIEDEDRSNIAALDRALRSNRILQVPPEEETIYPDAQATLPDVALRWENARADLRSLLESLAPADLSSGVFHHPFAGWMMVSDVLEHFSAHLHHHSFQLARLQTACIQINQ